ncbi:MurR/RpiR family transcriptional regulator [Pseudactinotalea sp. Z1739]|uniref:MurR/RpiR family transcriptional regulator n=1 Tax=Pseudactinotalea sp. Z1739 TaxID=3413028 RepID=UPI003C7CE91C
MDEDATWPGWVQARVAGRRPGRGAAKVLALLGTQQREMSYASTAAAASLAGVNVATVVRTAQLLGFSGWPALRAEVRSRFLSGLSAAQVLSEHDPTSEGPARATVLRELANLQALSTMIDQDQIIRVAQLVADARVTLVLGSGSFAAPGLQLAHLAQTIGHDVRLHQVGGTALVNAATLLRPGDVLVVFHLWRSPREVLNAASIAAETGAAVVVVADHVRPEFAERATETLLVPSEGASMFPSLVAAITVVQSIVAALVGLDAEGAARASDRIEGRWEDFDLFPPPGQ